MREVINIDHKWAFQKAIDKVPDTIPKEWYMVNLPHTWNAIDGQDGGADYFRGSCCYLKEIHKIDLPEQKQYYLEIN